ncbi:hypothetical protein B0T24DRAFT_299173 [Lasiosphaeria ovina]|uniref:Uncharacterized protein n=1 Tax=Lasiosphaeria ovina TaxID=92902 RepID=A0AAE0N4S1_9PEZI|nr:hypothetical protein B0T24DRAFT_299173 [Lasiosphaeria ovina]
MYRDCCLWLACLPWADFGYPLLGDFYPQLCIPLFILPHHGHLKQTSWLIHSPSSVRLGPSLASLTVLGRVIEAVSALRSQWKDANLTALAFETQLVAMRAALAKIEQWASIANEPHHQDALDEIAFLKDQLSDALAFIDKAGVVVGE